MWIENPPDNSEVKVEILPDSFDSRGFCTMCGGAMDLEYRCTRCRADFWPALRRRKQKS